VTLDPAEIAGMQSHAEIREDYLHAQRLVHEAEVLYARSRVDYRRARLHGLVSARAIVDNARQRLADSYTVYLIKAERYDSIL